jgi:hypothetical protein
MTRASTNIHGPGMVRGDTLSKTLADYIASLEQRIAAQEAAAGVTVTPSTPTTITGSGVSGSPESGYQITSATDPLACQIFGG